MIICDKCLLKCGKRAKLNDLRFYYILHFYYILRCTGLTQNVIKLTQNVVNFFNMVYVGGLV